MKCQYCDKPATFHITDLTEASGAMVMHLCEEHARDFLAQEPMTPVGSITGKLAKQLKLGQTAEELAELDQKTCPVCGISFYEFRNAGRLGCAYDYTAFREDLDPLLTNIHGSRRHVGKRPTKLSPSADVQAELIQLRRQMQEAVVVEEYERASQLRDRIRMLEQQANEPQQEEVPGAAESSEAGEGEREPRPRGKKQGGAKDKKSDP